MKILKYFLYRICWRWNHRGKAFKGMRPICYDEWLNNEYLEEIDYAA